MERAFLAPIDARRLAALRIGFGLLAFATFLWHFGDIAFHFSDEGWLTAAQVREIRPDSEWSILHFVTSAAGVRACFGVFLVAALFLTLGYRSRSMAFICFAGLMSIQGRNWMLAYGGDIALRLFLFFLIFSGSGRSWSIDAWLNKGVVDPSPGPARVPAWPLRMIQLQVATIYFMSGWAKLHGNDWLSGDAARLILLNPGFARWDWSSLMSYEFLVDYLRAITLMSLTWELLFPLLILFHPTRVIALVFGVFLHSGLLLTVDLHWFTAIMLTSYLAFAPQGWLTGPVPASVSRILARVPLPLPR